MSKGASFPLLRRHWLRKATAGTPSISPRSEEVSVCSCRLFFGSSFKPFSIARNRLSFLPHREYHPTLAVPRPSAYSLLYPSFLQTPVRYESSSSTFDAGEGTQGGSSPTDDGVALPSKGEIASEEGHRDGRDGKEGSEEGAGRKRRSRTRSLEKKDASVAEESLETSPLSALGASDGQGDGERITQAKKTRRRRKKASLENPLQSSSSTVLENTEEESLSLPREEDSLPPPLLPQRKKVSRPRVRKRSDEEEPLRSGSSSETGGQRTALSPLSPSEDPACAPQEEEKHDLRASDDHEKRLRDLSSSEASSSSSSSPTALAENDTDASPLRPSPTPSASPSPPSGLPELGIEEGIRFFFNLQPDTRPSMRNTPLVFNTLTGRMTNDFSPLIQILFGIGFGLNAQRQVIVTDPEKLNSLARKIRSGETTLDQLKWPPSLTKKIGSVLKNSRITDAAGAIQQLIKVKINTISLARYSSVVSGKDDEATSGVEDGTNLHQESSHENVELNPEQERAIDIALRGHHLYIGGSAGTGKTVLLRILCRRLQSHRLRVAMTATTGVAGCHIGGSTFHHAFGVSSQGEFIRRTGLLDYDVVIIDEISMMSQRLFDGFDQVLREEAGTPDLPFGGVQLIVCGDFLQLGSINESSVIYSRVFQKCFVKMRLQTIVRQNAFPEFASDLQLMRRGIVPENLTKKIQQLPPGTMVPSAVNLLPTNLEVHAANEKEMERLKGTPLVLLPETGTTALRCECTATMLLRTTPKFNEAEFSHHVRSLLQSSLDLPRASLLTVYKMYEDGHAMRVVLPSGESAAWKESMSERFLEIAPLINELDLEATVTEIVPDADGLHTGESEEFLQRQMAIHPIVQPLTLKKGCRVLLRSNLSSLYVNGSIGTVVDFVECKKENFPEYLRHENMDNCIERYRVFCLTECAMPIPMVPVVKFHNGKTIAVPPWEFTVGGCPNTQYYSLSSVCIPLTLAYAFTVHKVQGLTLVGRVHLELSKMWPCEHLLYVAMSRVRNPDQLSLSSFQPHMIVANKDCVRFDIQLKDAMSLTQEVLQMYPVASWKRCTDTIYQLRRGGGSLRSFMKEVTLGAQQHTGGLTVTPSQDRRTSYKDGAATSTASMTTEEVEMGSMGGQRTDTFTTSSPPSRSTSEAVENISSSIEDLPSQHVLAVENSVIVARRMRKLIRHIERIAKLRSTRPRVKTKGEKVSPEDALEEGDSKAGEEGEDNMEDEDRPQVGVEHF